MPRNQRKFSHEQLNNKGSLESQGREAIEEGSTDNSVIPKGLVAGAIASVIGAVQAQAAIVPPTFDSADAITVGTAVLTGLALIWAIKKAMRLAN